jgi:hypothetical protein
MDKGSIRHRLQIEALDNERRPNGSGRHSLRRTNAQSFATQNHNICNRTYALIRIPFSIKSLHAPLVNATIAPFVVA